MEALRAVSSFKGTDKFSTGLKLESQLTVFEKWLPLTSGCSVPMPTVPRAKSSSSCQARRSRRCRKLSGAIQPAGFAPRVTGCGAKVDQCSR